MIAEGNILSKGAGLINRIRFGLVGYYYISLLAVKDVLHPEMLITHTIGTTIILFYAIIYHVLEKRGHASKKLAAALVMTDVNLFTFLLLVDTWIHLDAAIMAVSSFAFFFVYLFAIMISGFLVSRKITISVGLMAALGLLLVNVSAY